MSHNKEFFHTTDSMPGAWNDKTVVRFDDYIDALRTDPVYTEFPFTLYDARGAPFEQKGIYTIVDGGYHAWRETIDAYKSSPYLPEMMFTCRQESVRKNVECAFGILKKRCERLNHGRARAHPPRFGFAAPKSSSSHLPALLSLSPKVRNIRKRLSHA